MIRKKITKAQKERLGNILDEIAAKAGSVAELSRQLNMCRVNFYQWKLRGTMSVEYGLLILKLYPQYSLEELCPSARTDL